MKSLSQQDAPLVAALQHCATRPHAAFYTPGHKRGQGISTVHRALLGDRVFRADLPELPELDNLFAPAGAIAQAQQLAAAAFGAEQTWFLANGSTCGIEAAILALCQPGDKIIVPRNAHRSVVAGLVLSGALPVYVTPSYRPDWGMTLGIEPAAIAAALAAHPDTKAVLVVSPSYEGICSDIGAIAAVVHQHGLLLIVDEAHGAHFAFHPDLPPTALAAGADIAVQSAHKVLSALTQAALLHVRGSRVDKERLQQALQLTQSTSPSYLLLASLDAARQQMATAGGAHMARTLDLSRRAIAQLRSTVPVLTGQPLPPGQRWDLTRLTVQTPTLGLTGWEADQQLHALGVTAELPGPATLTFIVSLGNTATDIERLTAGFQQLQCRSAIAMPPIRPLSADPTTPVRSPREAFYAKAIACPLAAAIDQISGETICPYPPGIPLITAGEVISAAAIDQLQQAHSSGVYITGNRDPSLRQLHILAE